MKRLRSMLLGEYRAVRCTMKRAIKHAADEGERVRSEDMLIYNMLNDIYGDNRKLIRRIYRKYENRRDNRLIQKNPAYRPQRLVDRQKK